jgi:hypothetical protein
MKAFQQTQIAFIKHIKDPSQNSFEHGIEDRRLKIYRDLFFNNVIGFLSSGFPVLKSLYKSEDWLLLGRQFYAVHQCRSPYFIDISKEFVEYLSKEHQVNDFDPPFLQELAHYEWLELALSVQKQTQSIDFWDGESPFTKVGLSELAVLVSYQYPVHQISLDFQPKSSSDTTFLVVYRNQQDEVNFVLINQVSAHLIELIKQNSIVSVEAAITVMADALPQIPADQVRQGTLDTIVQLLRQQILIPS